MLNEIVMDPRVRAIVEEYTKVSLRMHFKVLQAMVKKIEELIAAGGVDKKFLTRQDIANIKLASQAEVAVQNYIWTYMNLCVENGDLSILHKAWEDRQFRNNILVAAVSFVDGICAVISKQDVLRVPQETSLATPIQDN